MDDEKKHPGGRPSKYKPEYCQAILDYFNIPATYITKKTMITKSGGDWWRKKTLKLN